MALTRMVIPLVLLLIAVNGYSMPMFARRYGMECAGCHSPIPRLNEAGYKFRAAGYRFPKDIGKTESPVRWGDFAAARIQFKFLSSHTKNAANTKAAFDTSSYVNSNQLYFQEATFYPLTMAFSKRWSSLVELSMEPDGIVEVENGYLRWNGGQEKQFYSVRGGIMHPFEGYGASDRPISIARPLFETYLPTKAYYTIWNVDQMGVEGGIELDKTSLRATIFNGTFFKADEGKLVGAVGPTDLVKPQGTSSNSKDFQIFANQLLHEDGGGVSALFYHGTLDQNTTDTTFQERFNRLAGFASYPLASKLNVQGGAQLGTDEVFDEAARTVADTSLKSFGFFGGLDYSVNENLWLGARYDQFKPNTGGKNNNVMALTAFANIPLDNGVQFLAQYQYRSSQKGAFYPDATAEVKKSVSHTLEVRTIVIW